jgi:hypothetical protein
MHIIFIVVGEEQQEAEVQISVEEDSGSEGVV